MVDQRHFLRTICKILSIAGALNWGSIGLFDFNFVAYIFASLPWVEKSIYSLVGLSALYSFYCLIKKDCLSKNYINSAF